MLLIYVSTFCVLLFLLYKCQRYIEIKIKFCSEDFNSSNLNIIFLVNSIIICKLWKSTKKRDHAQKFREINFFSENVDLTENW